MSLCPSRGVYLKLFPSHYICFELEGICMRKIFTILILQFYEFVFLFSEGLHNTHLII